MNLAWDHWHIEPSSICTLKCPRCPRAEISESLLNRQLTLKFFQDQIGSHVVEKIKKITFCGNDGDPIYCRDLIEICRWLKKVNPKIHLVIVTNGSYKSPDWWKELAAVLDEHDEINWSIDGWDQTSNERYRVNCDWPSIMQGISTFKSVNSLAYCVWATIAFRFNQDHLEHIKSLAVKKNMDLFQLTKSTKFSSHYPAAYGQDDPLQPTHDSLVSSGQRFERVTEQLTTRHRPGDDLKQIFLNRANDLIKEKKYSGICMIGNKGVFVNSQGEFYPCCWTANRYQHNETWITMAKQRFNLNQRTFMEIISDDFWTTDFLQFDSLECTTKCTMSKLQDKDHVSEW